MDKDAIVNLIGEQVNPRFTNLENRLEKKVESETFWTIQKIFIGVVIGFASAILGLYVLYYSGLADLKTTVSVINERVTNIQTTLNAANITK